MDVRRVIFVGAALAVAALGANAAAAGAASNSSFSGKPSVQDVGAICITKGEDRGTVFVHAAVRYPDAAADEAVRLAGGRHTVATLVEVRRPGGGLIARDRDRGRAQVDVPELDSYVHTHQHRLSDRQSARVLGGKRCTAKSARKIEVRVRSSQSISAGGERRSASASAGATQSTGSTSSQAVLAESAAPEVANGCVYDALGRIDCAGAALQNVSFVGERLAYGDFSFASMTGADLSGVSLGHVIMNRTDLDQANLSGALLGSASLTSATLAGTNLENAQLPFANLANAHFSGAGLRGADLTGANLVGAAFENTSCDPTTKLPAAFPFACENFQIVRK